MIKKLYPLILILILCSSGVFAQVPAWGGGADYNNYSFGFHFSYISNDFKILKKTDWQSAYVDPGSGKNLTSNLNSISSTPAQGFAVGFIARLNIFPNLEIRTTPSLAFADRSLSYTYSDTTQNITKTVNSALAEIPLTFKLKSDRLGNTRAYLLGGVKYSYSITAPKKDDPNQSPLDKFPSLQRGYASYEAGVGCDIYFSYFKFSPEIKISNSFGNVLVSATDPYSRPIDKLFLHSLVFSIYFE